MSASLIVFKFHSRTPRLASIAVAVVISLLAVLVAPPDSAAAPIPASEEDQEHLDQEHLDQEHLDQEHQDQPQAGRSRGPGPTFGDDPLETIQNVASVTAAPGVPCEIPGAQLAALMMAPIWPETTDRTSSAPSPMTLSRFDDSPGLYAFGTPADTSGAFWHPGVGLWQMDSAGFGAPYTAAARIDVAQMAPVVATTMLQRFCSSGNSFATVWNDWVACNTATQPCQAAYEEIYDPVSQTLNPFRTFPVTNTGGMQMRLCSTNESVAVACGYVDPRPYPVGAIEGNEAWATVDFGASPLADPFYVFELNGFEVRHWVGADLGQSGSVSAWRPIGSNARFMLQWRAGERLCDLTMARGECSVPTTCEGFSITVDMAKGHVPTAQRDIILGTSGNDLINALGGDDIVCGRAGDDRIEGGPGADRIYGEGGDDKIYGGGGHDLVYGQHGNDTVFGQYGADVVYGGPGNDLLLGGPGYDNLNGGDGNDNVQGAGGNDTLDGGDGNDAIYGKAGDDRMFGRAGKDELYAAGGDDEAYGGSGDDRLQGAAGNDIMAGEAGDDLLYGQAGNDTLDGGNGSDIIYAAAGHDILTGGSGDDNLQGGAGNDELRGEGGADILYGQSGMNTLDGGPNADTCFAGAAGSTTRDC